MYMCVWVCVSAYLCVCILMTIESDVVYVCSVRICKQEVVQLCYEGVWSVLMSNSLPLDIFFLHAHVLFLVKDLIL